MRHLNLTAMEDLAVDLATEAATLITAQRPKDLQLSSKSTATDPVTAMDRRAEALVRRRLATARPGESVYGEEEGVSPGVSPGAMGPSSIVWVVDPIDGTVNYLYDIPHYAVSVAAVEGDPRVPGGWRPLAGAVADPGHGRVYHAHLGGGAWSRRFDETGDAGAEHGLQGREQAVPLTVNRTDGLATSLIATGFSYRAEIRREQALALVELLPRVRDIRRSGSAALDLCAVAAGLVDGYYEQLLNPWDIAAGWLMVTEAGGAVSGWGGAQAGGDRLVAGSEDVRRDLVYVLDGMSGAD